MGRSAQNSGLHWLRNVFFPQPCCCSVGDAEVWDDESRLCGAGRGQYGPRMPLRLPWQKRNDHPALVHRIAHNEP